MNAASFRMTPVAILSAALLACAGKPQAPSPGGAAPSGASQEETVRIPDTESQFKMVLVPGGKFKMGSPDAEPGREADEGPVREVELQPFWMGKTEVCWGDYALYYEGWKQGKVDGITRPTQPDVIDPREPFPGGGEQTNKHPAIGIGWFGVLGFCEWLSVKTGGYYRLATEAEWEYASRAGSAAAAPTDLNDVAWHQGNSNGRTHEVGTKKPNPWGLHDMLGNAMEACLEPYVMPEHIGVLRGGAWNSPPAELRHANRQKVLLEKWLERDPKWPLRAWWLTDAPFTGLRIVRLPDDGVSKEDREAAIKKVEVRHVKVVKEGKRPFFMDRLQGELVYSGTRPLDEVELLAYFLDDAGKPVMKDPRDKPAFNKCWPVIVNSGHPGAQAKPLKAGETRTFEVEVPHPFDEVGAIELKAVGARVTRIHFAKN